MDTYSSSTSLEKLKEYAVEEERRRDRKALPVLFGIILAGLLCWWLTSEREEHISNIYEGFIVQSSEYFNTEAIENLLLKSRALSLMMTRFLMILPL